MIGAVVLVFVDMEHALSGVSESAEGDQSRGASSRKVSIQDEP